MQRHGAAAGKAPAPAPAVAAAAPSGPASAPPRGRAATEPEVISIHREPPLKHPKLPLVIAHRGDCSSAPENTLTAFKAALAAGAHAVEFDVHITKDGQPVVMHDATVDRCTNSKGAVADLSLADIKLLDAGSWFAGPLEGEQVPTLDEAIEALPAPTVLFIHLRAHENSSDRCERCLAEAADKHAIRKRMVITHHTRHGLQRLREMDPALRLCWIPYGGQPGEEYVDDAYYLGCRFMQPRAAEIDEHFVQYAHEKGMWVNAFWADEVGEMERLIRVGVDGIITNYPRRLRETLKAFA
jgi:glycerophosphoryl diester phosphodiesterase